MSFYKIKYGYGETDYCEITNQELPKAYGMFLAQEGNGIFSDGTAIRARDIIRIEPNWHKVKGWNRGWKMTIEDYKDVKHLEEPYRLEQNKAKDIAENAIRQGNMAILSRPMAELEIEYSSRINNTPLDIKKLSNEIVNKFKI